MKIKLPSMPSFGRGAPPPPPSPASTLTTGPLEPGGDRMRLLARRLRGIAGYAFLFIAVFFVFVWVCLPTRAIAWRIGQAARDAGYIVDVEDLSISPLGGITLYNVRWTFQPSHAGQIPRKLELPEVDVDVSVLSLLFGNYDVVVDTRIEAATIHAAYTRSASESTIQISVVELPLYDVPKLQQSVNAPMRGLFGLEVDLTLADNLFANAEGKISIQCSGCKLGDGETLLFVPGATGIISKGITLPEIDLGSLSGDLIVSQGKATAEKFETDSDDITLKITGGMTLADPFSKSEFGFDLKLLIKPALQERAEPLKLMVQTASASAKLEAPEEGWLGFKLRGTGGRPKFMGIKSKSREEQERERRQKSLEREAKRKAQKNKREREAKNAPTNPDLVDPVAPPDSGDTPSAAPVEVAPDAPAPDAAGPPPSAMPDEAVKVADTKPEDTREVVAEDTRPVGGEPPPGNEEQPEAQPGRGEGGGGQGGEAGTGGETGAAGPAPEGGAPPADGEAPPPVP